MQYLVIGTTVVRVVGTYDTPDSAAAVAARLNDTPPTTPGQRELFKVDL